MRLHARSYKLKVLQQTYNRPTVFPSCNSTDVTRCECQAAMIPMQEHQSLAEWSEQACFEGPHRSSTMFAAIAKWGFLVWVK